MRAVGTIVASAALALIASTSLAQEAKTGLVTQIDRINGTIAIQQPQDGTVGAGAGPVKQYKVPNSSLETLHAGDQVSFTASHASGVDTITKIEKKKR